MEDINNIFYSKAVPRIEYNLCVIMRNYDIGIGDIIVSYKCSVMGNKIKVGS